MKIKAFIPWNMILIMAMVAVNPLFSYSGETSGDSLVRVAIKVNDTIRPDSMYLLLSAAGPQAEVKKFMSSSGGSYYPISHIFHQDGIIVQYGRFISFARLNFAQGFVNLKMVQMEPPVSIQTIGSEKIYFAPLGFLANAMGGTIIYDTSKAMLSVIVAPAPAIGSIFPAAANLATALDADYKVQQGEITSENLIDFCLAGYTPNANGNNVGVPYLGMQLPPPPNMDSLFSVPINFNFNADEAMVLIGRTPPECKYFSYRSYLMNRLYNFPPSTTRTKINASLGDMTNLYRMRPDLPLDSMFGRKFALIMAGDSLVAMDVRSKILASVPEIAAADIYFDIIPSEGMFQFGVNPAADWGMFAHRISLFKDSTAQHDYVNNPPIEILRITPKTTPQQSMFTLRSFLPRSCGINEFDLLPDLELLEEGIYNTYHADYDMIWLKPSPWVIEGFVAIQQGMDALGDNHDALYVITSDFLLKENDIALTYGVNHTLTGKSVYTNATIYSTKYMAGYGGITNTQMEKSARQFVGDSAIADRFYAYCFARHPIPGNPFVYIVPSDTNHTMEGINVDDTANFGFRLYVNSITKIGPDPMEVILDQAVLLRPLNAGIADNRKDVNNAEMKVFPNPVTDKATLELFVPDWSDISLAFFDASGRQVGSPLLVEHVRGTVFQEIKLDGTLPAGEYFIKGYCSGKDKAEKHPLTARLIWLGGASH
ncbi:MAG: hypothetical protein NTU98_14325 [Bacteroidetes bacterium]|nr:hypothetical protein [Bacteroidota bacterium]